MKNNYFNNKFNQPFSINKQIFNMYPLKLFNVQQLLVGY